MVDFMIAERCVKIETRKVNKSEIYFVKTDNRNDDILCGCLFTVENGHSNEFIMVVNVKSKVK